MCNEKADSNGGRALNEKFRYIVLADEPGGTPTGYRVILEDMDSGRQAVAQFDALFEQVRVDDRSRDYEAPEWRAEQIASETGLADAEDFIGSLKEHLRSMIQASLSS